MPNSQTYTSFFERVKISISDGTFAKLTLAKTIGNTQLMNIYIRTIVVDNELLLNLKFKFQQEEIIENHSIDEAFFIATTYINNPFLSVLLFTTETDVTMKLNKKRVATITEQAPTFKNADSVLLEYQKDTEFGTDHLALLSGGLDSRVAMMYAIKNNEKPGNALCFSQSKYFDHTISEKIAADFDIHYEYVAPIDVSLVDEKNAQQRVILIFIF